MVRDMPFESTVLEVVHALRHNTVGDTDVDSVRCQDTLNLREHLFCVGARAVAAQDRVESALVNHSIESSIWETDITYIHLLVSESGVTLFVRLRHLLNHSEGDIDICDVLVAILKHLLRQTYI